VEIELALTGGESGVANVLGLEMDPTEGHLAAGATLSGVGTREQAHRLIEELPESEVGPVVEFLVSRRDRDPDLAALLDEEADELLEELDAREGNAGPQASKP